MSGFHTEGMEEEQIKELSAVPLCDRDCRKDRKAKNRLSCVVHACTYK